MIILFLFFKLKVILSSITIKLMEWKIQLRWWENKLKPNYYKILNYDKRIFFKQNCNSNVIFAAVF